METKGEDETMSNEVIDKIVKRIELANSELDRENNDEDDELEILYRMFNDLCEILQIKNT